MNDMAASSSPESEQGRYCEAQWPLRHITLAGLSWRGKSTSAGAVPILMHHGWLDNSLSFVKLAPALAEIADVHAVDLAGHGKSGHRPDGDSYLLFDYVADLAELVSQHFHAHGSSKIDLVGHSLGGIVCALYAAAYPEQVRKLVMIDSLGALSQPVEKTVPQLRKAIDKRLAGSGKPAVYPDLASAAKAREKGVSPLSPEAALTLVPRNMRQTDAGYVWRTDPRLRHPSPYLMSEPQVLETLKAIRVPTLFLRAENGLLAHRPGLDARATCIADLTTVSVPGGHHCHLDGDTGPVEHQVRHFLANH